MNKLALLVAAAAFAAIPAYAGGYYPGAYRFPVEDHLEPVMTATQAAVMADKRAAVELILFKEAFADNVRARVRVYILPPGGYETMTFVTEDKGIYHLVYLYSWQSIQAFAFPLRFSKKGDSPEPPPDPHKAVVLRKKVAISPALAMAIITDWKKLLLQTRYATKHHAGFDGWTITLSMEDETGAFAGQTWTPGAELPVLDALQTVAFDMMMTCGFGNPTLDQCTVGNTAQLEKDVGDLTKALQANTP